MEQPTSPLFQLVDKPVRIDPPNMVIGFGDDYDRIFKKGRYADGQDTQTSTDMGGRDAQDGVPVGGTDGAGSSDRGGG